MLSPYRPLLVFVLPDFSFPPEAISTSAQELRVASSPPSDIGEIFIKAAAACLAKALFLEDSQKPMA